MFRCLPETKITVLNRWTLNKVRPSAVVERHLPQHDGRSILFQSNLLKIQRLGLILH